MNDVFFVIHVYNQLDILNWYTIHKYGGESCFLNGIIGHEFDPHFITAGFDIIRDGVAAIDADQWTGGFVSIAYFQVVIDTIVMVFDLERLELESHLKIGWHCDFPRTFFIRLVIIGEVRWFQVSALHV